LALAALDSGYTPAAIHDAAGGNVHSWSGEQSAYWESWRKDWEELLGSEDLRLKEVARIGIERATAHRDRSLLAEEAIRIYGD
jgi:hypothetical protein